MRGSHIAAVVTTVILAVGAATAGTATGQPAAQAPSAVGQRSLGLRGAVNARDIGGYRTADGRTVRMGLVFRGNSLAYLTGGDLANLRARDVRVIEDLRTPSEREQAPDRVPAGAVDHSNGMRGGYREFVTEPGDSRAVANVLRDIARADGALLYHCAAGKDRTGWVTAVLLTVLGVDRATVLRDYLLSNVYLHSSEAVRPAQLDTSFDTADRVYGSFDNYLRRGLGLTDLDLAALRFTLLD